MKKRLFSVLSIVIVLALFLPGTAAATEPEAGPLQPGVTVTYTQTIPINIVFIGYKASDIDQAQISAILPGSYKPVVRYPQFYGLPGRDMGLKYNFKYNFIYKNATFSSTFFRYLTSIGKPRNPTVYQQYYNGMANNILDVTGKVLFIDGPSVEAWLANNLGLPKNSYTIVFINWYGKSNFKFHVYTKTDEPDPDTGYNFGQLKHSRKMIAWGGTHSRLWFYDLSAGPEAWAGNYNVDDADLDGDGYADYRIPPIWEYNAAGYRDPALLSADLGYVTRFVAINLLFTSSPLYDPMVTAPALGGRKIIHINMMEDDPASRGTDWIQTSHILARYQAFQPYYNWRVGLTDRDPIDADAQRSFRIWAELDPSSDCWDQAQYWFLPYAQLFCYFDAHRAQYLPAYKPNDYVAGIHAFSTTDANMGSQFGLLGFADDNWVDGTQSYVFQFTTSSYRSWGYGVTATTVHEAGHHFGMSHPHDGYDSEFNADYGPGGFTYFAWSGDESHTVMAYNDLTTGFGQFNQDDLYRWETAGYLNWCNKLLGDLQGKPGYWSVSSYVAKANTYAGLSISNFHAWKYQLSAKLARQAYDELAKAAAILGVPTPDTMLAEQAIPSGLQAPHEGDPIRFPED